MIKKLNRFSFTFSPKALLSGRPDRRSFQTIRVLFSLGSFSSKSYCLCLPVVLSKKEKDYINLRVLLTKVKQFNCFLCKTTYSELLKELIMYYINILSLFKRNVFNYLRRVESDLSSLRSDKSYK